jgi:hypothetical protein
MHSAEETLYGRLHAFKGFMEAFLFGGGVIQYKIAEIPSTLPSAPMPDLLKAFNYDSRFQPFCEKMCARDPGTTFITNSDSIQVPTDDRVQPIALA